MVVVVLSAVAIAGLLGDALTTDEDFTGRPEAQRAEQTLHAAFPPVRTDRGFEVDETVIVSSSRATADEPRFEDRLETLATDLRRAGAAEVERGPVSRDGHSALLLVELGPDVEPVVERVEQANGANGFETLIVGEDSIEEDFSAAAEEDLARGELFGLALAMLVLIVVFRGLVAALVPVAVAVASIVVALAGVAAIGQAFVLNFVVVNVLVMMGLAVGIDYSLFVVSRFREERARGRAPDDAIAKAGSTASRAVLFSGATVVLALLGMFLVPHTVFRSIAVGAIVVVLVAVLAALTLLPATLSILGDRIERLRVIHAHPPRRVEGGIWSRV
ncbi:MAG TPA: MMPL family transporter, partial [Solirubrobacteraceae bacterium]|nr:MMPL family transporter [Solirubrobacteraceae bacterium]